MRVHLVTYATPRFRLRQLVLGISAKINGVVDTVTSWNPERLLEAGFEERCKDIKLVERGSGFWAWKPFIIQRRLAEVPVGDVVFYCDVGRTYPFKLLETSMAPFFKWLEAEGQSIMPGIRIPWKGPMSVWTKRGAFVAMRMDSPEFHRAAPIQASFSFWKAGSESMRFVGHWMDLCAQRSLISDDLVTDDNYPELSDFYEHLQDQSLLSLCCFKDGFKGIDLGAAQPDFDTQHPDVVRQSIWGICFEPSGRAKLLRLMVRPLEWAENRMRKKIKFGEPRNQPAVTNPTDLP